MTAKVVLLAISTAQARQKVKFPHRHDCRHTGYETDLTSFSGGLLGKLLCKRLKSPGISNKILFAEYAFHAAEQRTV
jgi:hypothetical protein